MGARGRLTTMANWHNPRLRERENRRKINVDSEELWSFVCHVEKFREANVTLKP